MKRMNLRAVSHAHLCGWLLRDGGSGWAISMSVGMGHGGTQLFPVSVHSSFWAFLPGMTWPCCRWAPCVLVHTRTHAHQVSTLTPNVALHHSYITDAPKQNIFFFTSSCTKKKLSPETSSVVKMQEDRVVSFSIWHFSSCLIKHSGLPPASEERENLRLSLARCRLRCTPGSHLSSHKNPQWLLKKLHWSIKPTRYVSCCQNEANSWIISLLNVWEQTTVSRERTVCWNPGEINEKRISHSAYWPLIHTGFTLWINSR